MFYKNVLYNISYREGFGDISKRNLTGYTFALLMFANITHSLL